MSVIRKNCNDKDLTEVCSCEDCRTPKTCLYYDNKNNHPGGLYGLMIETLSQQESFVKTQKEPYVPSECPACSGKGKSKGEKNLCYKKGKSSCPSCSENDNPEATKRDNRQKTKGGCTTCSKKAKPKAIINVDQQSKDGCTTCSEKTKPKATKTSEVCGVMTETQSSQDSCKICKKTDKRRVTTSNICGGMTDTLSKQQSATDMQKCLFISDSDTKPKCSCCKPSVKQVTHKDKQETYKDMMATLTKQTSAIETQKYAYLGKKSSGYYLGNKLSGIYEYVIDTLSRLTSSVSRKQEDGYNINCCAGVQENKPKPASEKKSVPKLCTTTSSTGPCMVEHLQSSVEYTHSLKGKNSKCRFNNNISQDEDTTTPSKSCGSMTETKKSSCNCSNNKNKQVLRLEFKRISFDKMSHLNSECCDSAESKHELPRHSVESKRYKPTKSAQELLKNIIQTPANKYQNTSDECDTEPPEYLIEPSKYTNKPLLQNESKCKPTKKYSESNSYVPELQKYMTIPNPGKSDNITRKYHNRCESKSKTSNENNSFVLKKQTNDNDLAQNIFENSGYVVELQNVGETDNYTRDAHIYRCQSRWVGSDIDNSLVLKNQRCCHNDYSPPNKTGNCEYVVEAPKIKEKKKCSCKVSLKHDSDNFANETVSEKTGKCRQNIEFMTFTNELPQRASKPAQQNSNTCHKSSTPCQSGSQQKSYGGVEYENESCDLCDSGKKGYKIKPNDIPGYVFEVPKITQDSCCDSNMSSEINIKSVCKNVNMIDTPSPQTAAIEMQKGKSDYNTREPHGETCCELKWTASDANNKLVLNKQIFCRDNDSAQNMIENSGNLIELQNTGKLVDNTRKSHYNKQICCHNCDSAQKKSDQFGCMVEQLKSEKLENNAQESCINRCGSNRMVSEANNKLLLKKETCFHDDDSVKKKTEGGYVIDLSKIKENRNCNCKGSTKPDCDNQAKEKMSEKKHTNAIMVLASELPKCCTPKPSPQNSDMCHKSSTPYQCGAQLMGYEHSESEGRECSDSGKNAFKMTPFKGPGYVVEIPKETQNGCDFNISRKSPITCSSNDYTVLCNNILKKQTDEIEKLKKIYLAKKRDVIKLELPPCTRCLPLVDLSETCTYKKINAKDTSSTKPKKVSKSYILDKINKLYNACRCSTCECAPSKSVGIDAHECQHDVHRHNEDLSKIVSKATRTSDCYRCKTVNYHCQSLVVAPVRREENISHLACTCLQCACLESGIVCPLAHNTVNEMSTSINRHALCRCEVCLNESCDRNGFDSCKCQKYNRFMSKLVEHDTQYFDIWTAKVVHNNSTFQQIKYSRLFLSGAGPKIDFNDTLNNFEFKMPSEYQKDNKKENHCMNCETRSQKYLCKISMKLHAYLNVACDRHLKVGTGSIPKISYNSNSSPKHETISETPVDTGSSTHVNILVKDFNNNRCVDECTSFTINGYMCLQCQEGNERSLCKKNERQNEISENCFSGHSEIKRLQNSVCLTDDQSFLKEKHEYYQAINDFNEFHVALKAFDNNILERNTTGHILPINDQVESEKSSEETPTHSDSNNNGEMLNVNYERVKNTLKKAKDFSLELIKLLETYEKANREFQSIKLSHTSLSSSSVIDDIVK